MWRLSKTTSPSPSVEETNWRHPSTFQMPFRCSLSKNWQSFGTCSVGTTLVCPRRQLMNTPKFQVRERSCPPFALLVDFAECSFVRWMFCLISRWLNSMLNIFSVCTQCFQCEWEVRVRSASDDWHVTNFPFKSAGQSSGPKDHHTHSTQK